MTPVRYGVYLANLDPTLGGEMKKTRPVVVVSQNAMNEHLDTVVVCPLTTALHPTWRSRIQIRCAGKAAEVAVDQIRTISKARLVKKLDALPAAAADGVRHLIGLGSRKKKAAPDGAALGSKGKAGRRPRPAAISSSAGRCARAGTGERVCRWRRRSRCRSRGRPGATRARRDRWSGRRFSGSASRSSRARP